MKKWLTVLLCLAVWIVVLTGCDLDTEIDTENQEDQENQQGEMVKVQIAIECKENAIFSKYGVEVYVDDEWQGDIEHGGAQTFELLLETGAHDITIQKAEDIMVDGSAEIFVTEPSRYAFKVSCYNGHIEVLCTENGTVVPSESESLETKTKTTKVDKTTRNTQTSLTSTTSNKTTTTTKVETAKMPFGSSSYISDYEEAITKLENAGFENIVKKAVYDIQTGFWDSLSLGEVVEISVDNKTTFKKGDSFNKSAKIVVTYREYEHKNPNLEYELYEVSTLLNDVEENEMRAEETYLNKYVSLIGWVDSISSNGDFELMPLDNEYAFFGVDCELIDDAQKDVVRGLSKGDIVVVKGKITDVSSWGCTLDVYNIEED